MSTKDYESFAAFHSSRLNAWKDRLVHQHARKIWPSVMAANEMSPDALAELQAERTRELINDVLNHVPYFQKWARENGVADPSEVGLGDLPILTKEDYRKDVHAFRSELARDSELVARRTSGSSGEPFAFFRSRYSGDYSFCCLWRSLSWHDLRPGDRRVYVWGRSWYYSRSKIGRLKTRASLRIRDILNHTLMVNAYDLCEDNVNLAIEKIERFKPVYLHGYASALYLIAQKLISDGRSFEFLQLKGAVTESEKLYSFQEAAMREAFHCPIIEQYGSVEFGNLAGRDREGRMRLCNDRVVVETSPSGEAIVTDLYSRLFPFVRYYLGDLITLGKSEVGNLPFGTIERVIGRTLDLFPIPKGGYIHGMALAHIIDPHLDCVQRYQIRQTAVDNFEISLASRHPLTSEVTNKIEADLKKLAGEECTVNIRRVDRLIPEESGKFRWVVSDVSEIAQRVAHIEKGSQSVELP